MISPLPAVLAATSVLLAAGADGRLFEDRWELVREKICSVFDEGDVDEAKVGTLVRMLARGPAFRARSLCWPAPTSVVGVASVLGPSGGDTTPGVPLGVRIFRPHNRIFFTSRIAR